MRSPKQLKAAHSASYTCAACGQDIPAAGAGTQHRNHCPHCLCSLHLDNTPGDREAHCGGVMEPVGIWVREDGEWALLHRCRICGVFHSNRIAADDNPALLLQLAAKPLAEPPFPLKYLGRMLNQHT